MSCSARTARGSRPCWTRSGSSAIAPIRSVEFASANASHGLGLRFDGADEDEPIRWSLPPIRIEYALTLGMSRPDGSILRGRTVVLTRSGAGPVRATGRYGQSRPLPSPHEPVCTFRPARARKALVRPVPRPRSELRRSVRVCDRSFISVHLYHSRSLNLRGLEEAGFAAGIERTPGAGREPLVGPAKSSKAADCSTSDTPRS